MVPETALFCRRQPAKSTTAQTAMTKEKRIGTCATLCAGNTRKGNGWLLENASGAEARDRGSATGLLLMFGRLREALPRPRKQFTYRGSLNGRWHRAPFHFRRECSKSN